MQHFFLIYLEFPMTIKLKIHARSLVRTCQKSPNRNVTDLFLLYILYHSVSKFHFLFKNYKFLKSLENGQFLFLCQKLSISSGEIFKKKSIFAPKLVKNCHFMIFLGSIFYQNRDFWPNSSS